MVREGRIFTSTAGSGRPAFGSGLMVNVLAPGAQVTQGSVSTTITVAAGHGFQAGDKYMVGTDLNTYSGALSVLSVTATTLELAAIRPVASGDLIVNLGPDSGVPAPMYDGNSVTVYVEQDYQNAFANGLVWADANGRYRYHHQEIPRWELVRTALTPIAIYTETVRSATQSFDALTVATVAVTDTANVETLDVAGSATVAGVLNANGGVIAATLSTAGDSHLGNSSTDTTTNFGRLVVRTLDVDPTSVAQDGTVGEVIYSDLTAKFYGKHTTSATDTNWRLMGT